MLSYFILVGERMIVSGLIYILPRRLFALLVASLPSSFPAFSFVCFVLAIRADAPSFCVDDSDGILGDCFTALIIIDSFQRFFLRECHHYDRH